LEQDQFVAAQVEAGEAAEKAHAKEIDVERALFGDRGADVSQRDGADTDALKSRLAGDRPARRASS
jgi:hypothetical protein